LCNYRLPPQIWCTTITIALAKPGKPDYSDPRRLIQLLECIGKVLEKIMADRLAFFLNKYKTLNLVPAKVVPPMMQYSH
jgi:hypothetical protein